ncbi:hypothetical protein F2Q68_00038020 [Brassica cretica]|uniref:DUF4283 domain-containing protein n=1 Tax=Brassica cretica TaxID=69181 RepID=A0A8S9H7W2_BRACR|nr:hypothetical protein F2Q68_00038020 [Brassica cretica]
MSHRLSRAEKGKWKPDPPRQNRRPPVKIPEVNSSSLIEENKFTLIGRVTNPAVQNTRALVDFFLQHWQVVGTITGRDLGPNSFQFKFESEHDMQTILSKAPFHFKAHKARTQTRKNSRTIPSLPSHGETRPQRWNRVSEPSAFDWNREKEFRVNYGARKELSSREGSSRIEPKGPFISRTPARERLSFRRDSSEVHRGTVSNNVTSTPRQTWRPVAEGSRKGNSDSQGMSQVSHTPSPRPQREEESLQRAITNRENQNSGNGSARSSERRSAHSRLSLPSPRIPLLQEGVANPKSGRLQEVPIQVLEDNPPLLSSGGLPSSSRKPSTPNGEARNSFLNRSPIRTLSEDRLHVSLRFGPIADSDPDNTSQLQLNHRSSKEGLRAQTKG